MWDHRFNFGVVAGAKHGYEGFTSTNEGYGETYEILEFPLISQFKLDFSRFRILLNIGTYGGYRLSTDKEGGYSFASVYQTNKYSDIYWIFTYPQNIMFSASLHFHLW